MVKISPNQVLFIILDNQPINSIKIHQLINLDHGLKPRKWFNVFNNSITLRQVRDSIKYLQKFGLIDSLKGSSNHRDMMNHYVTQLGRHYVRKIRIEAILNKRSHPSFH